MGKELIYSYIKEIALRLKEPRKYGEASVMIGAGFSKNAKSKGMNNIQPPNWTELADRMYCELYPLVEGMDVNQKKEWEKQRIIKTSGKNATKLAEEYIANFDRNKINNLIEEAISDDLFIPGELHKKLLKLAWGDIFTTNYDTLLEQTVDLIFRESNYKIVYSQNDLPGSIKPRIVKLHGSIPQVKPYIICDEDYRTYPIKYSAMVNTVQQAMLETRLCLIGFSGDDPNFQSWLGWIRDNMGEYCPKIYLIGIYDDLSEPEKRLLENKQITIIDISILVERSEVNRHYEAISKFLDLLRKFQVEEDIYQERPYSEYDIFMEPKNKEEYIRTIEEYSNKVWTWMEPYILLPENIREKYEKYFSVHFQILLKKFEDKTVVKAIGNIVKILRKCLVVLDDRSAIRLEEICSSFNQVTNIIDTKLESLLEIELYLLEMYRIDGRKLEYEKKLISFKSQVDIVPRYKNEMLIEKIKNEIGRFNYELAKTMIGQIDEDSFEYKVKKAGLYKQLSENKFADRILNECSAELAQMRLSDEIYSSYLGYLNLCYRMGNYNISEEYSDMNYYENNFNTRRIIVKQREDLSKAFFKDDCKEEQKIVPFNLNTRKGTTYSFGQDILYNKSFNFIITIDRLCLPLFRDQVELLPRVIKKTIASSEYAYWKLSLVIRADDNKVINQIFTRKTIESISKEDIKTLFESLISLERLYKPEDSYNHKKYIISIEILINVLSRLVIFLPDDDVIRYIKLLSIISKRDDVFVKRDINKIISRISTRFNNVIATEIQDVIFKDFGVQYHLASYFYDITFKIEKENIHDYYKNAIILVKRDNMEERDCGISQLLLLWNSYELDEYRKEIISAIWDNKNGLFPNTNLYHQFIWERLPCDETVEFHKLYYSYLLEDRYVRSVTKGGIVGNNSLGSVYDHLNFFYSVSKVSLRDCKKINADKRLCVFLLDTAYEFIEHEKSLLDRDNDILGDREKAKMKFEAIGELVALIYINAITEGIIELIRVKINNIKQLLTDNHINIIGINMVEVIEVGKYVECMDIFESTILSKNERDYSRAFIGFECLLYYLEKEGEAISIVNDFFENFMSSIKYIDIEYAKTIWIKLIYLIEHDFFMNKKSQEYIAKTVRKCLELYNKPDQKDERYYLDGLYNCVSALHNYYKRILDLGLEVSTELEKCVEIAKEIENYEVKNIWS